MCFWVEIKWNKKNVAHTAIHRDSVCVVSFKFKSKYVNGLSILLSIQVRRELTLFRTDTHTHTHMYTYSSFIAFGHFISFRFVLLLLLLCLFFNARKIQFQKWVKWVNNVIITILFIRDNMLQLLCVQVQHCMPYKLKWICTVCTQHMLRWTFSCVYLICMFAGVEFSFTL